MADVGSHTSLHLPFPTFVHFYPISSSWIIRTVFSFALFTVSYIIDSHYVVYLLYWIALLYSYVYLLLFILI